MYSDYVAELMASFYEKVKMLNVLERFRVKSGNSWKSGVHVDIVGETLLPKQVIMKIRSLKRDDVAAK